MKKLSSLTLSIIIALSSNAYANALPNTTPQPTNPTLPPSTSPTPIGSPTPSNTPITSANSHNYNAPAPTPTTPTPTASASGGKTGVFGKIVGNLKKVTKPNPIEVGITLGVGAVSYIMTNSEVQKLPQPEPEPAPAPAPAPLTGCKVEFGNNSSRNTLSAYIAEINSRTTYSGKGGYKYNVSADSISALTRAEVTLSERYNKMNKAVPLTNATNMNIKVEVTDPNDRKFNHYMNTGVYVSCAEPAPQPEENPQDKPQEQPQPQPQTVPVPMPTTTPNPNADPNAQPNPNTQPVPTTTPNPNADPNAQPTPNNDPNAQPQPVPNPNAQPNPATGPEEFEFNLDFEFPAFCDWAKPVCDFVDWFKSEPPQEQEPKKVPKADLSDLGLDESELFKQRVNFDGQCPKHELKFSVMGHSVIEPIPMFHFCNLLEQLAPWLLAFSYLSSGFFVIRNL